MAAWNHYADWSPATYDNYRRTVQRTAPSYKGSTEDCADLSIKLIVDFAASNGLSLTFKDNVGGGYCSKSSQQWHAVPGRRLSWGNKEEYYNAVKRRLNATALWNWNTVKNPRGPEPGDLMLKPGHAALVFAVYPPGMRHPKSSDQTIPTYPGEIKAAAQINVLEYFRDGDGQVIGPPGLGLRFDYLNHRGEGSPIKQRAELIYYASVSDHSFRDFQFRSYNNTVLLNWTNWNGVGEPF
jgi:hypothetical protein